MVTDGQKITYESKDSTGTFINDDNNVQLLVASVTTTIYAFIQCSSWKSPYLLSFYIFLYLQITIYNRQTFHFYLSKRRFQIKLATLAALPLISLLYFSTLDDEKKLSLLHCFFDEDISFSSSIRALQFYLILQG